MPDPYDDPGNWRGGRRSRYVARDDPRIVVPKRLPALGWTINFGHPRGLALFLVLLLAPPAILLAVVLAR